LNHGGKQDLHPEFFKWFPCLIPRTERIFLSDQFLQRQSFAQVLNKMKELKIKKNIVIVGASHSGMSAAWMLLNGPADLLHNTHVKPNCKTNYEKNTEKPF
jgi:hypothetical protein